MNPIKQHFRLKKPCANCPFLKEGAIPLSRGRLEGIISTLIEDDHSTFQCHKTVHSKRGGNWDDEGNCGFHADSDTHSTHIRTVIPR